MLMMNTLCLCRLIMLLLSAIIIGEGKAIAEQKYVVSDLGVLKQDGSVASAINDHGEVIGTLGIGDPCSPQTNHSFLFSKDKATDFGHSLEVKGINNSGQLVGAKYLPNFQIYDVYWMYKVRPVLYTDGHWKTVLPKGAYAGYAVAVNDAGQIAGQLCLSPAPAANKILVPVVWANDTLHCLETPATCVMGFVRGINNNGQAVGSLHVISSHMTSAALWDIESGKAALIGTLPGADESDAVAINTTGCVLCTATFGRKKLDKYDQDLIDGKTKPKRLSVSIVGFLWKNSVLTAMTAPDDQATGIDLSKGYVPHALNDADTVVGRATGLQGEDIAFIWQDHHMSDLNTLIPAGSGWTLINAKGINNKGQIVGWGQYKGDFHAFLLTPQ